MANVYYTCNLVPLGLVQQMGHAAHWLGNHQPHAATPARRDATSIHPMTCPCVTQFVATAEAVLSDSPSEDCLIVPSGCDAMRRLGDLLASLFPGRVFSLALPRAADEDAIEMLSGELVRLQNWLCERPASDDPSPEPPAVDWNAEPQPGGVFVVAGPLGNMALPRLIADLGAGIAGVESCTSPDRWESLVSLGLGDPGAANYHREIARELMRAGVCPRRSTSERLEHLAVRLEQTQASSVIYARQSFCDPGAYDAVLAAELAEQKGLRFMEIEVGFPLEVTGPLRTRVEAFLEAQLLDDDLLGDDLYDDGLSDGPHDGLSDDLCDDDACDEEA